MLKKDDPILDRVTAETTLGDVGILLGRYGVREIDVRILCAHDGVEAVVDKITGHASSAVTVTLRGVEHATIGKGLTVTQAFDDALSRLLHRVGDQVAEWQRAQETEAP